VRLRCVAEQLSFCPPAPSRPADPITVEFLAGNLVTTQRVQLIATYEPVYQIWVDGWYEYERIETGGTGAVTSNGTFGLRVRTEF